MIFIQNDILYLYEISSRYFLKRKIHIDKISLLFFVAYKYGGHIKVYITREILLCSLSVFILFALACDNSSTQKATHDITLTDEILIGIVYPIESRDKDTFYRKGIDLALDTINNSGGIDGRKIKAIFRDDRGVVHTAMQIAETFKEHGTTLVLGHWSTNVCYFVIDVYEKNEVVMLTPAASGMNLFDYEYDYIFRMCANNQVLSRALANFSAKTGHRRIAIFYDDDEYGLDFATAMESELNKLNIDVVDRVSSITVSNIRNLLARWNAFGCDGIYIASSIENYVEPIKILRQIDKDIPIFGADNFGHKNFLEVMSDYTDNVYIASYDIENINSEFYDLFVATYGHAPDTSAISGFESLYLLKVAVETTGSIAASEIATYLSSLKDFPVLSGVLSYNATTQEFDGYNVVVRKIRPQK